MISRFIVRRNFGHDRPAILQSAERTRRTFALELSHTKSLEVCNRAGVHALDIDPAEGKYLLTGSQDRSVVIYDLHAQKEFDTARRVASGGSTAPADPANPSESDGKHVPSLQQIHDAHKFSVETVQWYPHDNGLFTTSGTDGVVKLWDANTMTPALEFENFCGDVIYQHTMSPIASHGLIAVGGRLRKVKLCDPTSGASTHELVGHSDAVLSVAWSPSDEYTLASASRDNTVMLWDVRTAGPRAVLDQHNGERHGFSSTVTTTHTGECNGVAFTPDGRHIVTTGADSRVRLWQASDCKNMFVNYTGITNTNPRRASFCISPHSRVPLLFHPSKAEINVYNLFTGALVRRLRGHYGTVKTCLFHPDLEEVYSGSQDSEVLVWSPRFDWAERPNSRRLSSSRTEDHEALDEWSN